MRARSAVRFAGRYIFDSEYTAKLQAAHLQSVTGTAFDAAMLRRGIESDGPAEEAITMLLTPSEVAIRWPFGGETYPLTQFADGVDGPHVIIVVLDRYSVRYSIEQLAPGVIRLANRLHELHEIAWRRTGDA